MFFHVLLGAIHIIGGNFDAIEHRRGFPAGRLEQVSIAG
jgi:hypothetical protein